MGARAITESERAVILGLILSNPKASIRELIDLCACQGVEISRTAISNFKKTANEMVYSLAAHTQGHGDVITRPVVQSGLIEAANRINELNDIYYKLKAELEAGGLWSERSHTGPKGDYSSELVLNDGLIREMRGCLNDIAKEVGGRSTHAVIEHRNADTGTVDIHALILNVQQTAEARKNEALEAPEMEVLPPAKDPKVIDYEAESEFVSQYETAPLRPTEQSVSSAEQPPAQLPPDPDDREDI